MLGITVIGLFSKYKMDYGHFQVYLILHLLKLHTQLLLSQIVLLAMSNLSPSKITRELQFIVSMFNIIKNANIVQILYI